LIEKQSVHVRNVLSQFLEQHVKVVIDQFPIAHQTLIAMVAFVKIINANMYVVNQVTVQLEKDASIMLVLFHVQVMVNVEKIKLVLAELACWDVEVIVIVQAIKLVSIINVKIHVSEKEFVDQMLNVQLRIIKHLVNVHQHLNQIQHQIKDVFVFQTLAEHQKIAAKISCVSLENVIFHVKTTMFVQLVKDVSIICAQKSAIQITIAYLEKFVMKVAFVFLDVLPMLIVLTLKFVSNQNVNVLKDTLTHLKDALILMNVLIKFVILLQFVKMFLAHSNVVVHQTQSEILTMVKDVVNQLNVIKIMIVLIISHVKMENVSIHVQ
jgi:hypothetical protein